MKKPSMPYTCYGMCYCDYTPMNLRVVWNLKPPIILKIKNAKIIFFENFYNQNLTKI
jgi:hypothetical protein